MTTCIKMFDSEISERLLGTFGQEASDAFDCALSPYEPDVLTPDQKMDILNEVLDRFHWDYRIEDLSSVTENEYEWVLKEMEFDSSICSAFIESWSANDTLQMVDFNDQTGGPFPTVEFMKDKLARMQAAHPDQTITLTVVFN